MHEIYTLKMTLVALEICHHAYFHVGIIQYGNSQYNHFCNIKRLIQYLT